MTNFGQGFGEFDKGYGGAQGHFGNDSVDGFKPFAEGGLNRLVWGGVALVSLGGGFGPGTFGKGFGGPQTPDMPTGFPSAGFPASSGQPGGFPSLGLPGGGLPGLRLSPEARERHRHQEEEELNFLGALAENFGA